jgi:hypothetical protein
MFVNPDRADSISKLDALVPPLPQDLLNYLKYWTAEGYQSQLLSDWQMLVLRLLWHQGSNNLDYERLAGAIASAMPTPRIYKPMLKRVTDSWTLSTTQSMTVYNKGRADGTLEVAGNTFTIEPGEAHSWTPPGQNILCEVTLDGTGTMLVIDYLEEIVN